MDETAQMPERKYEEAAAYDIRSNETCTIPSEASRLIRTGIRMDISPYAGILTHRSGQNTEGLWAYGTIDPDYRGEIKVCLFNFGLQPMVVNIGDRIAQLRLVEIAPSELKLVDELNKTCRGNNGHGSSGLR